MVFAQRRLADFPIAQNGRDDGVRKERAIGLTGKKKKEYMTEKRRRSSRKPKGSRTIGLSNAAKSSAGSPGHVSEN